MSLRSLTVNLRYSFLVWKLVIVVINCCECFLLFKWKKKLQRIKKIVEITLKLTNCVTVNNHSYKEFQNNYMDDF